MLVDLYRDAEGAVRMPRRAVDHRAFTLIELITTIVIVGIVGAGMAAVLADVADIHFETAREAELGNETWIALERIAIELRQTAPAEQGGEAVTVPSRGATGTALVFTRPSAAEIICPACVDHSTAISFLYTPEDFKLWRDTAAAPMKLMADHVSAFAVTASDDPAELRTYEISLSRATDPADPAAASVTMTTIVYPSAVRNGSWATVIQ